MPSLLGIEAKEKRTVALMGGHAFFMGASTVFFETAVAAFFLARFDTRYLPWVYVAAAVVNMITGTAYAKIQHRVRFGRLMSGTLWFLLVSVIGIRVGIGLSTAAWLAFGGLVWYRVLSILTDLEYWAVAARVYDVRQAKRLFGLIGTGEVVARIVGAFSVPIIVRFSGVANLIVLSAAALAVCLVLLGMILREAPQTESPPRTEEDQTVSKEKVDERTGLWRIVRSPYLILVVGVAVFATFGKYFVDFAFLQQMATRSRDEEQLASLLGIINGATQALSLLTRVFVSRPLLHRFGVRIGLLVLPSLHLLCTLGILATSAFAGDSALVFWFAVANQGVYDTFKHPIDNPSFKVLYQPLARTERLATQIAVEAVINPVVIGIAGGVVLLFSGVMRYSPGRFALVLLVTFVAWWLVARLVGSAYLRALVAMLQQPARSVEQLDFEDATTIAALQSRLARGSPSEVRTALQLLEKGMSKDIVRVLVEHAQHEAPEVRRYSVERLTDLDPAALWPMRRRLSSDPEASVRGPALRLIASQRGLEVVDELAPHLDDADRVLRRAVVAYLFALDDTRGTALAKERIERWARSPEALDRRLATRLGGEHAQPDVVLRGLEDEDPEVRRAALSSAGLLPGGPFDEVIFAHLGDRRFAETAIKALVAQARQSPTLLDEVDEHFVFTAPRLVLARLARICSLVAGPQAIDILWSRLTVPDVLVRGAILFSLDRLRVPANEGRRNELRILLNAEIGSASWSLGALRDLSLDEAHDDLRRALETDVVWAGRRVLRILPLLYDRVPIERARDHLAHPSKETRAYAMEVLDLALDVHDRDRVLPVLDEASSSERLRRLEREYPQGRRTSDEVLVEVGSRPARFQRAWTRALALRIAARRGLLREDAAATWRASSDPLLSDAVSLANESSTVQLLDRILLLKSVPMFAETTEEVLAEIAGVARECEFAAGHRIVTKGDVGDSMYIVISGQARVFDGARTLSILGEREIFGELALFDPAPRSASVEAIEDTRLFRLDDDTFSQCMAGNLEMVRGVLHVLCERLRRTSAEAPGHG